MFLMSSTQRVWTRYFQIQTLLWLILFSNHCDPRAQENKLELPQIKYLWSVHRVSSQASVSLISFYKSTHVHCSVSVAWHGRTRLRWSTEAHSWQSVGQQLRQTFMPGIAVHWQITQGLIAHCSSYFQFSELLFLHTPGSVHVKHIQPGIL